MFDNYRSEVEYRGAHNIAAKILCAIDVHTAKKLAKKEGKTYEETIKYVRYVRATERIHRRMKMGFSVEGMSPWVFSAIEEY